MRRSFMAYLADKYIRVGHRITAKAVMKDLQDYTTDKDNYKLPKWLKFHSEIKPNYYNNLQVFEMSPKQDQNKIIMYIHGGGYINNFSIYHWLFLQDLTKKGGYGLTAPNYPLLPKYSHRQSHEKIIEYYRQFSLKNDMSNVILMGDSAGGGFALALLQNIKKSNLPMPSKVILLSPFVDVEGANAELRKKDAVVDYDAANILGKAWAGNDNPHLPQVSPLYGDLTNLPPIHVYVGTYEILLNECIEVCNKLKEAGNNTRIYIGEKMGHVYPLYPIKEGKQARKQMLEFIEQNI